MNLCISAAITPGPNFPSDMSDNKTCMTPAFHTCNITLSTHVKGVDINSQAKILRVSEAEDMPKVTQLITEELILGECAHHVPDPENQKLFIEEYSQSALPATDKGK